MEPISISGRILCLNVIQFDLILVTLDFAAPKESAPP
jgi:hypothetical protein